LNHYLTKLNLSSRCSQVLIFSSCLKFSDFLLMYVSNQPFFFFFFFFFFFL